MAKHLEATLHQVRLATGYRPGQDDFLVAHLARFVPVHLDLFLARLSEEYPNGNTFRLLIKSVTRGANEEQRETIATAIRHNPNLMPILIDRGWFSTAGEKFISGELDLQVFRLTRQEATISLLAMHDPRADRYLLEAFRNDPSYWHYERLHYIPRLRQEVEAIARDLWSPGPVLLEGRGDTPHHAPLRFGLSLGRKAAVDELFVHLSYFDGNLGYSHQFSEVIEAHFVLPREVIKNKHDSRRLMEWLSKQAGKEFVFDPVLRKFHFLTPPSST